MEHLSERISEGMQKVANQPSQRAYQAGTHQRGGVGVGQNAYGVKTLVGTWQEEQADTRFHPRRALLYSDQEKLWQTEVQRTVGGAKSESVVRDDRHVFRADQPTHTDVMNRKGAVFPGHQPQTDLDKHITEGQQWTTETTAAYGSPGDKSVVLRKFVGGKAMTNPWADKRPQAEQVASYTEQWTRNSQGTQKQLVSESRRSYLHHPKPMEVGLKLLGIPIVDKVREKVWKRAGKGGFRGLTRVLRIMDDNGNRKLNRYELQHGLMTYGLAFDDAEMQQIMEYFDRDDSGQVSIGEFIRVIRGPMNERRALLVRMAYDLLDINMDGRVTMDELCQLYDPRKHPDVMSRSRTPEQVLHEFASGWDKDGDGTVLPEEFRDYYEDVSSGIDHDDYFELMLRNAWHISGGEGACANTSCRRVLVTHIDGSRTVEEIQNDLRIRDDDVEGMKLQLKKQGILTVRSISLAN